MNRTIFILGTDPEHCAELRNVLQAGSIRHDSHHVSSANSIPRLHESDTIVLSSEERNAGVMYRQLLQRLEEQVNRGAGSGRADPAVDVVSQSGGHSRKDRRKDQPSILGDTAFIVLDSEAKYQLEAAFSSDSDRLKKMLITAVNVAPQAVASELLRDVLEKGEPVVVSNLQHLELGPELQTFIEKYRTLLTDCDADPRQGSAFLER